MPTREAELAGWVAAAINNNQSFQERAKQAAAELDADQMKQLVNYFIYPNNPPKPSEVQDQFNRLGEWQSMSQWAIFEIFYNRPEDTLPIIREIAFGIYDWTQLCAISTLCRLANEGVIEREKTIDEIMGFLPKMNDIATDYTISSLSMFASTTPKVIELVTQKIDESLEWEPDLHLLSSLTRYAPDAARSYREPLFNYMNGKYESAIRESPGHGQIQAAITLSILFPEDKVVTDFILKWAKNHTDAGVRYNIRLAIDEIPHLKRSFSETGEE